MKQINTQVCILGAGAGGTGCAYRLIKKGIKTVVVDKYPDFGGTAVFCGVDGWEPGVSLDGIHLLLKEELEKMENGCHIVEGANTLEIAENPEESGTGEKRVFSTLLHCKYEETLKRCTSLFKDGELLESLFR